jgi:hypothetical protein
LVTTLSDYTNSRYRINTGEYSGVVRISADGYYGTGTLLYGGRAILTSAHLLNNVTSKSVTVAIDGVNYDATYTLHGDYDSVNDNNDLAILWLNKSPKAQIERYDIYRDSDEIGQTFTMVGYGKLGSGSSGAIYENSSFLKLKTTNSFDGDFAEIKSVLGYGMGWSPTPKTQLAADFDNGSSSGDAMGLILGVNNLGVGLDEGLIAPGDSGGPAFIDSKIAGVASYTASLEYGGRSVDVDDKNNSSFGEIASWQRVSNYAKWIDQTLRSEYKNVPTTPQDVQKSIIEGDADEISYVYFLLQFTAKRDSVEGLISVEYATRDGSAIGDEDYISASGTLVLYENETQAVIPVEIIGDNRAESDEYFYLDVYNPIGGSFGEGIVKLTAIRTILDNDTIL